MYTVAQLITKFRDVSGENSINPIDTSILKYINMAINGSENVLSDLYPVMQNQMGTAADPIFISLVANQANGYTTTSVIEKVDKLFIKYNSTDEYKEVDQFIYQGIHENDPIAGRTIYNSKPIVGFANNKFDIYPKPTVSVTNGLKIYCLVLPADLATGGTSIFSNKVDSLIVSKAIFLYYRSMKMLDLAKYWNETSSNEITRALSNAPGRQPEIRIPKGRGNISSRM